MNKKNKLIKFIAIGFGSGLAPVAPGTFGTLAAVPIYYFLQHLPLITYGLFIVLSFAIGVWFCEVASKQMGVHDDPAIVWDEMLGYWLTMFAAPEGWLWIVVGFALFRLFDIWKPWPISRIDKTVSGGFGIMLDDVVAGVYALVILQLAAFFM